MEIYPSLISSDLLNLQKTINILQPVVDGFHIDVMDDHFVPNLTWGPAFVDAIVGATEKPLHVHIMVDNPTIWTKRIKLLRDRDTLIFHYEAIDCKKIPKLIEEIKNQNVNVGIAINPKTDINVVFDFLPDLNNVLIMSVNPGFSGQRFMPQVMDKITPLFEYREKNNFNFKISMDGGIGQSNIKNLVDLGVDQFGIACAIFSQKDWIAAVENLKV
ncbi:MAG: ribulose-phosphate 3-epimerase [bacterium]